VIVAKKNETATPGLAPGALILRLMFSLAIAVALFFVPAGRLDWWAGWRFLALFFAASLALYAWLRRRDPDLVAERQQSGPGVERWDRVIMGLYTPLLLTLPVVAGLDAGRFGWSAPSLPVQLLGWLLLAVALAIVTWTMAANTYLSERVRIQEERGHHVVTGGPYRYVRHPMYVGVILALLGAPLALASLWALIPAAACAVLFVVRTALEDQTLQERLPGYQEYAGRVRYRLFPSVW
jgi:protein-S-isoprenylcysteine O-methyltransferase Ste14